MAAKVYSVEITCDREGCSNPATVMMVALGTDDEPSLLCPACVTKIGQQLEAAQAQYDRLLSDGVDERLARHIVGARIDRKEV